MNYPQLETPPVILALFQLKFEPNDTPIDTYTELKTKFKNRFNHHMNNIEASIAMPATTDIPLGKGEFHAHTDAKLKELGFVNEKTKEKLTISNEVITYISEADYEGWNHFKDLALELFQTIAPYIKDRKLVRASIRFINRFEFESLDDPSEYFKTLVASSEDNALEYPIDKYSFRLRFRIDEKTYSIVNQELDPLADNVVYTFDIDVLQLFEETFSVDKIPSIMESLRDVKNNIFFSNITNKLLERCN